MLKNKYTLFHKKSVRDNIPLKLSDLKTANKSIKKTISIKFLGAMIDEKIIWEDHIYTIEKKLAKNLGLLHIYIFSIWVFFHEHSRIIGLQGKGKGISLTPHYHSYPLHKHLDISRAITAKSSPLHIVKSRARTGNIWFPSANR